MYKELGISDEVRNLVLNEEELLKNEFKRWYGHDAGLLRQRGSQTDLQQIWVLCIN